jgi:hypothetical protein
MKRNQLGEQHGQSTATDLSVSGVTMAIMGYDRNECCAVIEQLSNRRWRLFWPRRGWSKEDFKTLAGAKAKVETVIHSHQIEWRKV